jgi:gamma-glutamyltranspeptidase/glutathione hydrolase
LKSGTRGVVAAGSETTATAGGEILAAGGNAVDAAVAACLATAAGEPTLTSLAGGGVMLYRNGQTGKVTISDFFANAPGLGGEPQQKDFFSIELDFGPTVQSFHIGAASAAIPGVIPGLMEAHDRWGLLAAFAGCRAWLSRRTTRPGARHLATESCRVARGNLAA